MDTIEIDENIKKQCIVKCDNCKKINHLYEIKVGDIVTYSYWREEGEFFGEVVRILNIIDSQAVIEKGDKRYTIRILNSDILKTQEIEKEDVSRIYRLNNN